MTERSLPHRTDPRRPVRWLAPTLALVALGACNSASSPEQRNVPEGTYDQTGSGDFYFVDSSFGGQSNGVRIQRQFYGRLVDVAAQWVDASNETQRRIVHRDFVIDPRAESGWTLPNYALETNSITGEQTLVIFRDFTDTSAGGGRSQFANLLFSAEAGLRPVADNGFVGAGTYTVVPRNAAFVLDFDDLIDASTINGASVRVLSGVPTIIPEEARIIADPNHGDVADFDGQPGAEFYTTRVIIDPTVSIQESFERDPPLPVNNIGLPPSDNVNLANIQVRIATQSTAQTQQLPLLQNPSGGTVTTASNGTFDFGSATLDVVRAFRSGGQSDVTGDPDNGFLPDETPPTLVGSLSAVILDPPVPSPADGLVFSIPAIQFVSATCAQNPQPGDLIQQDTVFLEVQNASTVSLSGLAEDVVVRLVAFPPEYDPSQFAVAGAGPIQYQVPYVPGEDVDRAACFISVTPPVPDPNAPSTGVLPGASFSLTFSEALDPGRFEPYDSFRILRTPPPTDPADYVPREDYIPGFIFNSQSLRTFIFDPALALSHRQGQSESYYLDFPLGPRVPRDLAGNEVSAVLPPVEFTLDPSAAAAPTGGRVTRFSSADEEPPFANTDNPTNVIDAQSKPEWFGQLAYDEMRGRVRPRPVIRTQVVASESSEIPARMAAGTGASVPLSPFGARTQILWRYCDFGDLPLTRNDDITEDHDFNQLNLDVEGVSLSPLGGNPVFESYPEFRIAMAHSLYLPDEVVDPFNNLIYPQTGLQSAFALNLLDGSNDPLQIVHPRSRGYTINPGDQSVAGDGTPLLPLPMNQGVADNEKLYYTWRDTAIRTRGGPNGQGAPPGRYAQVTSMGRFLPAVDMMGNILCGLAGGAHPFYPPDQVRTAALPLLLDIRCYPTGSAATTNIFADRLAHSSTLPGFRAYSAGGRDQMGAVIIVDPDSETVANGGFDPTTTPPGGPLPGVDNTLYVGALDLVVRVSRAHSIYFRALDPLGVGAFSQPTYAEPAVFPASQPLGTRVEFAYRGATSVDMGNVARQNASRSDAYGDYWPESKPVDYLPPDEDPAVEEQGGASCFDGSWGYPSTDPVSGMPVEEENPDFGFLNNDDRWKASVAEIEGATLFQVRMTMVSNASTGLTPEVSSIGFSWQD